MCVVFSWERCNFTNSVQKLKGIITAVFLWDFIALMNLVLYNPIYLQRGLGFHFPVDFPLLG